MEGGENEESSGSTPMNCFFRFSPSPPPPPSSSNGRQDHPPPSRFLCPISGRLMADPVVIVQTGHHVEWACLKACSELNYIPSFLSSSSPSSPCICWSSLSLVPSSSFKIAIDNWCNSVGHPLPLLLSRQEANNIVEGLKGGGMRIQEPTTGESRTAGLSSCWTAAAAAAAADRVALEEDLRTPALQIPALHWLMQQAELSENRAVSLCSRGILAAVRPLLLSDQILVLVKASKAIVVLSRAKSNRIMMAECEIIPPLQHILAGTVWSARTNAATALRKLARDEENLPNLGRFNTIPLLLRTFYDDLNTSFVARKAAASALSNLTLHPESLSYLAYIRAVPKLMDMAADASSNEAIALQKYSVKLLLNLSGVRKGRGDLINVGVVDLLLRLANKRKELMSRQCVGVLDFCCLDFHVEFTSMASAIDDLAVLKLLKDEWDEGGKLMAKNILEHLKNKDKAVK